MLKRWFKPRIRVCHCLLTLTIFTVRLDAGNPPQPEKRRVTVEDAIRMRQADRSQFVDEQSSGHASSFSRDGRQFLVITKRGNIERNTNEYDLLLFKTKDVFRSPKPETLLAMSSSSNREAISHPKWLDDGETVVFLGENPGEVSQVWSFNLRKRKLEKLTNHPSPIVSYDISGDGSKIVYEAQARRRVADGRIKRRGVAITTQSASTLLDCACDPDQKFDRADLELFVQAAGHSAAKVQSVDILSEYAPLSVSPSGHYALLSVYVRDLPRSWAGYEEKILHSYIAEHTRRGPQGLISQYMLLDLRNFRMVPLLDAPLSFSNAAFAWSKDGESVVLSGVYLPLDAADPAERKERTKHPWVLQVKLAAREIVKITDRNLLVWKWDRDTGHVLLRPDEESDGRNPVTEAYEETGSVWVKVPVSDEETRSTTPVDLILEEDLNTPPKIFAIDPNDHRKTPLLDLNPQFAELQFGKVEAVSWKASDGHETLGGLYLPPDYKPGTRYPLVIQTHGFTKDRFWINGPFESAFAAQPLAAKGIIVLQVGVSNDPGEDMRAALTPLEAPRQMAAYEGAIDELDRRGLIDRSRVGILGFSRTVYYVEYALTHSSYRFAAASVADGIDGGYLNYLLFPDPTFALVNGGPPAGATMTSWIRNSPGFNLEKVTAPVHVEYYGRESLLAGWQWFSGLSLLGKPVDFVWLPTGVHMLVKPWERLASQQGTVDWFAFWLKHEKDTSPAKVEQYERWEELRGLEEQNDQAHYVPLGR